MFVCNFKVNNNLIKKIGIITIMFVIVIVFIVVSLRFYHAAKYVTINDDISNTTLNVTVDNYASILKDSHENIDKYVGKEISFTGFVYRLYDFSEQQFVLAREMIISSDNQSVVVGFLCDCSNINIDFSSNSFEDGTWISVSGVIEKGFYHGDMPVINIKNIQRTNVPANQYVMPPSSNYVDC